MKRIGRLGLLVLAAGLLVSSVSLVSAPLSYATAPAESITLSPVSKKYQLNADQTIHDTLTVLNDGTTSYDFTVYATPYWVNNAAYQPNFTSEHARADAYLWISFDKTTWHITPRQTLTIPYTMHVPANAAPGGHYGTIFVEMQPNSKDEGSTLMRKKRVGSIVYATVNGAVHLSGETTKLSVPWFQTAPPMTADATFKNTGNSDFVATASYTISDIFGATKAKFSNDYEILPGTTRATSLSWSDASWFGLYRVQASASVLGKTTTTSSFVLVMPVWIIALVLLLLIGGGVYGLRRRSTRSISPKE